MIEFTNNTIYMFLPRGILVDYVDFQNKHFPGTHLQMFIIFWNENPFVIISITFISMVLLTILFSPHQPDSMLALVVSFSSCSGTVLAWYVRVESSAYMSP